MVKFITGTFMQLINCVCMCFWEKEKIVIWLVSGQKKEKSFPQILWKGVSTLGNFWGREGRFEVEVEWGDGKGRVNRGHYYGVEDLQQRLLSFQSRVHSLPSLDCPNHQLLAGYTFSRKKYLNDIFVWMGYNI